MVLAELQILSMEQLLWKDTIKEQLINLKYMNLFSQGNVSKIESTNEIKIHPHGTWYDSDFKGYGGHIFEADVAIVAEIYIKVYPGVEILRKPSIVAPHLMEIYKK